VVTNPNLTTFHLYKKTEDYPKLSVVESAKIGRRLQQH
jgi:hypothetical protein